jgi:hypothetical protein
MNYTPSPDKTPDGHCIDDRAKPCAKCGYRRKELPYWTRVHYTIFTWGGDYYQILSTGSTNRNTPQNAHFEDYVIAAKVRQVPYGKWERVDERGAGETVHLFAAHFAPTEPVLIPQGQHDVERIVASANTRQRCTECSGFNAELCRTCVVLSLARLRIVIEKLQNAATDTESEIVKLQEKYSP